MHIPAPALRALRDLVGPHHVCTDELSLQLHAFDCSLSRMRPDVIVHIPSAWHVAPVIQILHRFHIPFIARAAATNHAGSCATPHGGAVLNLSALTRIVQINTREEFALVEPGVITGQLEEQLAPLGYFYAPDPASKAVCTLGGNVAQNASGARCLKYGGTLDHVLAATVVLPDGTVHQISRQEAGPDWLGLLCGSEGTLGIITQLKVKILPAPKHIHTFLITFPSLDEAVQAVTDLAAHGVTPRCVEAMDHTTTRVVEDFSHAGYPTNEQALLLIELDGKPAQIKQDEKTMHDVCKQHHAHHFQTAHTAQERARLWQGRQAAYSAMARLAPNVLVCDGTVPRSELPRTLKHVQEILTQNHARASLLFHAADGNFHPQLVFDERNPLDTQYTGRLAKQILRACLQAGGTISGEHGIGIEKRSLMTEEYDADTLTLFTRIKRALDPENLANPGKIIPVNYTQRAAVFPPANTALQEIQHSFSRQIAEGKPFFITGNNTVLKTKQRRFSTAHLNQITDVDLTNYTLTAQTGVTLNQLAAELRKQGVYSVLPGRGKSTLGSVFSSGMFPGFYAQVTGLRAVLANGSSVRYGGKVTKNAAGYNLIRLFAGAQGTFGLVTELTFKIYATKPAVLKPQPFRPLPSTVFYDRIKPLLDPQHILLNTPEESA